MIFPPRLFLPWVTLLSLLSFPASSYAGECTPDDGNPPVLGTEEIESELTRFLHALDEAIYSGKAEELIGFFTEDSSIFYPAPIFGAERIAGVSDIRKAWDRGIAVLPRPPLNSERPIATEPQNLNIQTFCDFAIVTFELGRASQSNILGRRTLIWKRYEYHWRIVHLHASAINR